MLISSMHNWLQMTVFVYLTAINVLSFFLYGIDKYKAKKSKWRVKESTLIGLSIFGGSIGAWLGMKVWHHKTHHKKFKYGLPLILIAQIVLAIYLAYLVYFANSTLQNEDFLHFFR